MARKPSVWVVEKLESDDTWRPVAYLRTRGIADDAIRAWRHTYPTSRFRLTLYVSTRGAK